MLTITSGKASALAAAGTANNPFVAWDNLAASGTLTSNRGITSDGSMVNAVTGTTWDAWRPATSGSIGDVTFTVQLPASQAPDLFGIVGANLKSLGVTAVDVQSSADGVSWSAVLGTIATSTDAADALLIATPTARAWWRVVLKNVPALAQAIVPCIFLGTALQLPVRTYQGHSPILTPTEVDLQSNVSAGGNYLGAAVVRRGSSFGLSLDHVDPAFLRGASWLSFQRAFNEGKPAFSAWRPTTYPADLHYIWRDGAPIRPTNSGPRDFMSLGIEARAYER